MPTPVSYGVDLNGLLIEENTTWRDYWIYNFNVTLIFCYLHVYYFMYLHTHMHTPLHIYVD